MTAGRASDSPAPRPRGIAGGCGSRRGCATPFWHRVRPAPDRRRRRSARPRASSRGPRSFCRPHGRTAPLCAGANRRIRDTWSCPCSGPSSPGTEFCAAPSRCIRKIRRVRENTGCRATAGVSARASARGTACGSGSRISRRSPRASVSICASSRRASRPRRPRRWSCSCRGSRGPRRCRSPCRTPRTGGRPPADC